MADVTLSAAAGGCGSAALLSFVASAGGWRVVVARLEKAGATLRMGRTAEETKETETWRWALQPVCRHCRFFKLSLSLSFLQQWRLCGSGGVPVSVR